MWREGVWRVKTRAVKGEGRCETKMQDDDG
jgi:hypothetical protein